LHYEIRIQAGVLSICTHREALPLRTLLDFASRQNPKRCFLFVSKVLGKHIPCRPVLMRRVYDLLARPLLDLPGPIVVIGMAETATGLGAGVAHSLAQTSGRADVLYLHTTRHPPAVPLLFAFDENHSHAPEHSLYAPQGERWAIFEQARSLILVDDEISTGRTLGLLAVQTAAHLPHLAHIELTSIVNWLTPAQRQTLTERLHPAVGFTSLLEGEFSFHPDPHYQPALPLTVNGCRRGPLARHDTGRAGLLMATETAWDFTGPTPAGPLTLLGVGEFAFAPFLAAERLEREGHDVVFQSTTRSPINAGDAIRRKLIFTDEYGEGIVNYLYNLPTDRQVIIAYEDPHHAARHDLPALVKAQTWVLA